MPPRTFDERLRYHAQRFRGKPAQHVLNRYEQFLHEALNSDELQKNAFHVAAWVAELPAEQMAAQYDGLSAVFLLQRYLWALKDVKPSTLPVVPLQQAHEQVILQALAQHFVLDPAQILFLTRPGSARRLQTVSLAKCSLDFVVEVLPSNDANSLEQRLGRFGSAWSFDSFRQRLATAMNESGLVLPSCFSGDPTVAVQHVQVINDFALASSEWLASEWGACPGLCGEAVHSRGVECSTGNEYACNVSGNKPPTTQRCEIYVDCPFDWNCPFGGPGADLACPVQLFLFVTGVVIVSILLLCILRLVVRHFCCQRPKGGELALYGKHGQQMKVNFYIVEQKGEQEDLNVMKMLSLQSKEAEDPSKLHVVWDVDVEKAQKMEIEKWKMKKIGGGITSEQQQRALQRLPGNANNGRKYARQSTGEMLRMSEQEAKVEWALSQKSHKTSSSRRSSPSRRVSRDASPSKSPRSKSSSGGAGFGGRRRKRKSKRRASPMFFTWHGWSDSRQEIRRGTLLELPPMPGCKKLPESTTSEAWSWQLLALLEASTLMMEDEDAFQDHSSIRMIDIKTWGSCFPLATHRKTS
eukprot:g8634.t1